MLTQYAWIVWLVLILVFVDHRDAHARYHVPDARARQRRRPLSDLLGIPWWLQVIIAAVVAVALILTLRPPLLRRLRRGDDPARSNVDALIGLTARCCSHGHAARRPGEALQNGDIWTARLSRITERRTSQSASACSSAASTARPPSSCPDERSTRRSDLRELHPDGHRRGRSSSAVFIFVLVVIVRSIRIIPQANAGVVERLGRYHKTLMPGLNILVPFIDRVRPLIDMRETGRLVPAAAGDHRGQPRRLDRHGRLLPGDRCPRRDVRDRATTSAPSSS